MAPKMEISANPYYRKAPINGFSLLFAETSYLDFNTETTALFLWIIVTFCPAIFS